MPKFSGSAQGFRKHSLRLSFPAEGGFLMLVTAVPRKWKRKDPGVQDQLKLQSRILFTFKERGMWQCTPIIPALGGFPREVL